MERASITRWIRREEIEDYEGVGLLGLDGSLFDFIMTKRHPSLSLQEIDELDILREMRLMDAQNIDSLATISMKVSDGSIKPSELDKGTAEKLIRHEEYFSEIA